MKSRIRGTLAVCAALLGLLAPTAAAADPFPEPSELSKSAGQKFRLKVVGTGKYVTLSGTDQGAREGALRARAGAPAAGKAGLPYVFTLHTSRAASAHDYGETISLRSAQNGLFVTAERDRPDPDTGMLRARTDGPVGGWERFTLKARPNGAYALKSAATGTYLSARDSQDGLLRAMVPEADVKGWETFVLEPVAGPGSLVRAPAATPRTLDVMSWNVCANNGAREADGTERCSFYQDTPALFTERFMSHIGTVRPDAVLLQEFCEKYARPLENALEAGGGPKWDVRFAPIEYRAEVDQALGDLTVQKPCVQDSAGGDRGAYGVAIAVPEENTFYAAHRLTSPAAIDVEQRTALCATVPSWSVHACTTHFSPGSGTADTAIRTAQAAELRTEIEAAAGQGYRTIFGGDLNATPGQPGAVSFYDAGHRECDQSASTPTGTTDASTAKIDYVFGPADGVWSACAVKPSAHSDHHSVRGKVTLP
ncbi:endonuclease/exonuclease/phosphatase family protein [Streptomyces sp. NPDC020141]|uniref:endonuclease/exonuclease/phosphatase family protein n=1 Tax=Streptomyces sp. NPDC020141 TaxID=3365065 RepID=UPI0037A544CB